jgi:mono/diheme cytochrome c family protein
MKSVIFAFALAAITTGCAAKSSDRTAGIVAKTGVAESGKAVYAKCSGCHGADGKTGTAKIDIVSVGKSQSPEFVNQVIAGGGGMPVFATLSDQEIADVLAYVKSL